MHIDTRQLFRLLCQPALARELSLAEWQQVIFILREAKLLASFCISAERQEQLQHFPAYAKRHLISAKVYANRQAQQVRFECAELHKLLAAEGIEVVFLKGAAYTLANTTNFEGRICSDLDVLVKKPQLDAAEALLQANSWRSSILTDYDERYYREWAHEIPPLAHMHRGTVLDLHHNLYLPISGRAADMKLFFAQLSCTVEGYSVLAKPAMVLHSIIHLFTNEDTSSAMRDLWDLYLLLPQHNDDAFWQQLTELACKTGFNTELLDCLAVLQYYFAIDYVVSSNGIVSATDIKKHRFWRASVLPNAMVPEHSSILTLRHKLAKQLVYLHGHWIKMPATVLVTHLMLKSWLGLRDKVFGKYHFDPKLPPNQHW